jgi:hypothetical protein
MSQPQHSLAVNNAINFNLVSEIVSLPLVGFVMHSVNKWTPNASEVNFGCIMFKSNFITYLFKTGHVPGK